MNKVIFSSISKKFVMALAGLFLLLFLPVHLVINLMLLKSDPESFNSAAHFMATFPPVKVFEVVLIGAILIHLSYGLLLQIQNWIARPVAYKSGQKAETSFFSRFMIWTGGSIFILNGLTPGSRIVTAGANYLQPGMKVRKINVKTGD